MFGSTLSAGFVRKLFAWLIMRFLACVRLLSVLLFFTLLHYFNYKNIITVGLSTLFSYTQNLAEPMYVLVHILRSGLQSIAQIRNICAHHGRLWNKNLPGRPKLLPKPPKPWIVNVPAPNEHYMLYFHLCCMKYLMNTINPGNSFTQKLLALLAKYPNIDPNAFGIKANWFNEPLWK